jgi:hypothetical protein
MGMNGIVTRVSAFVTGLIITVALCIVGIGSIWEQSSAAAASDLSRSFSSVEKIESGSLVSLQKDKEGYVEGANVGNAEQLVGVAVVTDGSLLAVNSSANKTQVAISGQATTIVSDLNGTISPGDLISTTPFTGVGAKALAGDRVVGVAQASFDGKGNNVKSVTVTDKKGKSQTLKLGNIPVVISVGTMANNGSPYGVNKGLEGFATNIAGKPVSLIRVAICLIIGLVAVISLVIVVYSTIRNGISAVARNPLAKPAIFDSMAQVMVMVAFIAVVSIVIMYAVLRI